MRRPGAKALVCYKGKILLVLRDNNPNIPFPNVWNTPGGGIEVDETPEQAVIRELKEEVNLDITNPVSMGTTTYDDGSLVYRFYVPISDEQFSTVKLVSEGQRLEWLTFDEVLTLAKQEAVSPNFSIYLDTFSEDIKKLLANTRINELHKGSVK